MAYIEWIELETFFSGYLFVYAVIYMLGLFHPVADFVKTKILPNLPLGYALIGTLYLALQLRNGYPDYYLRYLVADLQSPYLKIWGLLSIFFWLPVFYKKAVFSMLHSLVFFFLLMKNFYFHFATNDRDTNNMKIYTVSIRLNLGALILITFISFLINRFKGQKQSTPV